MGIWRRIGRLGAGAAGDGEYLDVDASDGVCVYSALDALISTLAARKVVTAGFTGALASCTSLIFINFY